MKSIMNSPLPDFWLVKLTLLCIVPIDFTLPSPEKNYTLEIRNSRGHKTLNNNKCIKLNVITAYFSLVLQTNPKTVGAEAKFS